uniref:Minor structural protein n=2 Tax=Tetraparvovirus ungulate4 TaxID=3052774 RepID=A0A5K7R9H4_9VIRU|nr:minor structural protein [Tetraparvovirus ungulate4]AZZ69385.1 minor structural protein [Tetraparvovirus ungulate4]AZZ69391.1 minor structural protein [Tetraparvovirus ungulate4]
MSATDSFRPGGKMPLDSLMRKLTVSAGTEPSRSRWGLPGGYIADLTVGVQYEKAFTELARYARSLPLQLFPVKQLAEQLVKKRIASSDIPFVMRVFMDLVRLLIMVAPEAVADRLRRATDGVREFFQEPSAHQHSRAPRLPVLYDLYRSAHEGKVPSKEEIDAFFNGMLTPFDSDQRPVVEHIHQHFLDIFHPPPVHGHGGGVDTSDSGTGTTPIGEPDLERPPEGRFLVPGYNYVGPGNPLDNGPAKGPVDEAAKHHDERYDEMLSHGDVPYIHGHGADRLMNREIEQAEAEGRLTDPVDRVLGNVIRALWQAKETLGDVADVQISQVLPPAPPGERPDQDSSDGPPSPKRARTGIPHVAVPPITEPAQTLPHTDPPPTATMASNPAGGAGGGVKVKAQWIGGTSFSDSVIITAHTRTSMLADRGGYVPVYQKGSHTDESQPVLGMKTPYSYIDVNAISAHLTPRDFQQLLDEYDEIRPKKLVIGISAIVIKDVRTNTTGTTVSDSASGGITIFADDAYEYPYVLGHNQDTLPGHLPGENYVLPQYGYLTRGREIEKLNDIIGIADHKTELYFLEHHDAQCLGSGDTWSLVYDFPADLPFRRLSTPNQTLYGRHNPIPDSRLAIMTGVDQDGKAVWTRPKGTDVGRLPLNHVPGPSLMMPTDTQLRNINFRTPVAIGNPQTSDRFSITPLVHQPWSVRTENTDNGNYTVHNYLGGVAYTRRLHEESYAGHQAVRDGTVVNPSRVVQTDTDLAAPHVGHTFFVPGHLRIAGEAQNTVYSAKMYQEPVFPLFPGAVWHPNPLSYDCQIWTKIPDTECHFLVQYPSLGGWGVAKPPPMIFLKLISQPGPPPGGAHTVPQSNLNQYVIFHLHYSMEFEVKRRKRSRRHNPEKPAPFPTTASGRMAYALANDETNVDLGVYEVPEDQWLAENFSHKL